jgi:hypothetical protein
LSSQATELARFLFMGAKKAHALERTKHIASISELLDKLCFPAPSFV